MRDFLGVLLAGADCGHSLFEQLLSRLSHAARLCRCLLSFTESLCGGPLLCHPFTGAGCSLLLEQQPRRLSHATCLRRCFLGLAQSLIRCLLSRVHVLFHRGYERMRWCRILWCLVVGGLDWLFRIHGVLLSQSYRNWLVMRCGLLM